LYLGLGPISWRFNLLKKTGGQEELGMCRGLK
jgi:hypothetical protein